MKKMIVSDYDGTFYRSFDELKENIKLIHEYRKQGHLFVIATGRSYESFKGEIDKYHIPFDYLIVSGGMILDQDLNVIFYEAIHEQPIEKIQRISKHYQKDIDYTNYVGIFDVKSYPISPLTKIAYRFNDVVKSYEFSNVVLNTFKDINCYVMPTTYGVYVEIISSKTNKGIAVKFLQDKLKLKKEQIFVIGDSSNDLEMIEMFDGYIVSNAKDDLKTHQFKVSSVRELIIKQIGSK